MNPPESVPSLVIYLILGIGLLAALVSLWRLRQRPPAGPTTTTVR
jgi:hypothetical protein